ncbi:MAG: sodium:proton antiporter [Henriciella sp.]|jgi:Na+/H+ antiporter NhaC|uniref:Na+/H+ antiporter NhaC family protein n=3 Tax=Henriciella TaxID=453849 RepID=UPI000C552BF5|nr:sodium:proton antiporter [Henriciella sp.]MBF34732.1 sodium:proton antiporter [Hyphomonadaceae bacterium]|tara:strand:- start:617 stop:1987 length:1371 start_codon:yes stop_codon:yes gene_type:complete
MADWLTLLPPLLALAIAVWSRNVYWALGLAIWTSETLNAGYNPALGFLASVERAVSVFGNEGNTRILLFCLIIGALIEYMRRSGGIAGMVDWLIRTGAAGTRRRAGSVTVLTGMLIFVETNISLLTTGIMGRPLFDRLKMSRERLAYIIDSTSAPVSILILLNGWGAFVLGLISEYDLGNPLSVLVATIPLNFYALFTLAGVWFTVLGDRTFGPMHSVERRVWAANDDVPEDESGSGSALNMGLPILVLVGGALGLMLWTGNGNMLEGSGSQAILWAVCLATVVAFLLLARSGNEPKGTLIEIGFKGMGDLLPAVTVIFLALVLGASLKALGTGEVLGGMAANIPFAWALPAIVFVVAGVTSFTTGTSWGTYGILVPVAIPLALGSGVPPSLALAAVLGGGVFGDHCSPISDTSIIASLAAECDHLDHVRTQLPYAVAAGLLAVIGYLAAGLATTL